MIDDHREAIRISAMLRRIGYSYYAHIPSRIQKRENITKDTLLDYDIVKVATPERVIIYDEKTHGQPMGKYRNINPVKFGKYYYLPIKKSVVDFYGLKEGYRLIIMLFNIRNKEGEGDARN